MDHLDAGTLIALDPHLIGRVSALAEALRARKWHFATAESCTGGLIAGACTALAGSSEWFDAGFVTYSNEAKQVMLGVSGAMLAEHGAVSEPVAAAMARGALERSGADLAVAVTGIAGPGGGSVAKPVGTVWLGLAWRAGRQTPEGLPAGSEPAGRRVVTECLHLDGDRAAIRAQTVLAALEQALAATQAAD